MVPNSSRRHRDTGCLFAWGDRLGADEVTDSSCPGSAGDADACGLPQPRPAAQQQLRCASANSRPTISGVAPASANIGPMASASSLGWALEFSSRPISFAIWAMAVRGIILDFSRDSLATLRHGATMHSSIR
jgi:hypothetical protein